MRRPYGRRIFSVLPSEVWAGLLAATECSSAFIMLSRAAFLLPLFIADTQVGDLDSRPSCSAGAHEVETATIRVRGGSGKGIYGRVAVETARDDDGLRGCNDSIKPHYEYGE